MVLVLQTRGRHLGHLPVLDVDAGEVVTAEKRAQEGALWTVNVCGNCATTVTGGANGTVVSWNLNNDKGPKRAPDVVEDVVPAWYGRQSGEKRLVFVVTLNFNAQFFSEVSISTDTNCQC